MPCFCTIVGSVIYSSFPEESILSVLSPIPFWTILIICCWNHLASHFVYLPLGQRQCFRHMSNDHCSSLCWEFHHLRLNLLSSTMFHSFVKDCFSEFCPSNKLFCTTWVDFLDHYLLILTELSTSSSVSLTFIFTI